MTYSAAELDDIAHHRDRLRAYYWRVAHNARRMAAEHRRITRMNLVTFDDGHDLLQWASTMDRVAAVILDNIETLVETTYEGE